MQNPAKNQPLRSATHPTEEQQLAIGVSIGGEKPVVASALTIEVSMARNRSNGCGSVQSYKHPGNRALELAASHAVLVLTLLALLCAPAFAQSALALTQSTTTTDTNGQATTPPAQNPTTPPPATSPAPSTIAPADSTATQNATPTSNTNAQGTQLLLQPGRGLLPLLEQLLHQALRRPRLRLPRRRRPVRSRLNRLPLKATTTTCTSSRASLRRRMLRQRRDFLVCRRLRISIQA